MEIVSNDVDGVHGLPWRHVFKLRDSVAYRWFLRYRMLIPLAEFQSGGNLGIAQAMRTYAGTAPFGTYLTKVLHHRMSHVVRAEWSGWVEYVWGEDYEVLPDGRRRRKELARIYHTPNLVPLVPQDLMLLPA
jgi:hypothetical protein